MRKLGECDDAVSPIIGVTLMVGLTVIMSSVVAVSVFAFTVPESAPHAKIVIVEAKGGLPSKYGREGIGFDDNTFLVKHKGGDSLRINDTKIIIRGYGQSYRPCFGCGYVPSASPHVDEIVVIYKDATTLLKDNSYKSNNPSIDDGFFSPGESILFSGEDRGDSNDDYSGVVVFVREDGDNSNKYAFKNNTAVTITFLDIPSNQIIASTTAYVKKAK